MDVIQRVIPRCFRAFCCKGPPSPRTEYDVVCVGLTGSGKSSLLTQLCSESTDNIIPTTGFSIKAVPFQNAILNVKELGGADNIRKYWSRYYQGSQGVVFVLDSASSEDDLETARNELHSALQHPQLCTLPFLILANHQDKPAARSLQERHLGVLIKSLWHKRRPCCSKHTYKEHEVSTQVLQAIWKIKKYFELEPLARGQRWILQPCSVENMDAVREGFNQFISLLEEIDQEHIPGRI
ncbi:ADP-ribosylation factor-like protein 15 isoform X3 [Heterodontus francisci]|uniref:ADP-ribosylation factor-like protein 15 isoform X3 n=1 Tax=Heterodontus francisci TaxID=7792 RepID=UPI00355ADF32